MTRAASSEDGRRWVMAALVGIGLLTVLRLALIAAELVPLFGDEAKYWAWAQQLDFGYRTKPPMVAWVIAATTALAGDGELGIRLASPLLHAATAAVLMMIGGRLFDRRVGATAAILYATMPAVSLSSLVISTDVPLLLFWSLALYALIRALDGGGLGWWAATGAATGLALLSKYTAIAFPLSALLLAVISPEHRRRVRPLGTVVSLLVAGAVVAPNLWWNARHGFISLVHVGENADLGGRLFHPDRMLEFLASQLGVFGPVSFVVLLVMVFRWRTVTADVRQRLLLVFVLPLLGAITLQALLSKANANWAAPVYSAATVAVAAHLAGRRPWLTAALMVNLAVGLALYAFEPVRLAAGIEPPARFDPAYRNRGWPDVGRQLAGLRREHPGTMSLFDYELVLTECLYYTPLAHDEVFFWNPGPGSRSHWELVNDLESARGRDFLFISRRPDLDRLERHFESVAALRPVAVRTHPDRVLTLYVARADGFRGTPAGP